LRAGAGLVTVACPGSALDSVAAHAPEIMTEALPETPAGVLAKAALHRIRQLADKLTLVAIGPGIGTGEETQEVVHRLFEDLEKPMVIDADALNCLAKTKFAAPALRVFTPHPGEMSRLADKTIAEIQEDRIAHARAYATERKVTLVLKGEGTLIAFPDGRVWINPTGSPAMATGGTGDILTGMTAGLLAQFPEDPDRAVAGAVYLHGLSGEIAARHLMEQPVIATDLLRYLGEGIRAIVG
jgi:ADP-dependent NAD(P)H-hydrate dehydratase / NAD(P)H-hydrate epimerase